jgi:RNA polymerase sigma factor (sigma-70 family)
LEALSKAIRSLPKLNGEEERELWQRCKGGDLDARNRLALHHIDIVFRISKRFFSAGLTHEDLFQEGVLGLFEAIDAWEPDQENPYFCHRAALRIKRRIWGAIWDTGYTFRVKDKKGHSVIPTISIFAPLQRDNRKGDDGCIGDLLADHVPGLDDMAEEKNIGDVLDQVLRSLPRKEETVLRRHYGIGVPDRPLEDVGEELGVSRQRIHQIEKAALARLRRRKEVRALVSCR